MSDDSEEELMNAVAESREELNYRRKYQMLLERCEVLQQDNERLVNRIQHVYKYTGKLRKEREFIMNRLEKHGDDWQGGISQFIMEGLNQHPVGKQPSKQSKKPSRRQSTAKTKAKQEGTKGQRRPSKEQRNNVSLERNRTEFDGD